MRYNFSNACPRAHIAWLTYLFLSLFIIAILPSFACSEELDKRVEKHTLKNGLRVLLLKRQFSPTVSFNIRFIAGAVDEDAGRTGTAHFLEHLLFKGTKSIGSRNIKREEAVRKRLFQVGSMIDAERMKGLAADQKRIAELKKQLEQLQKEERRWTIPNEIDRLYTENGGLNLNASTGQDLTSYHVSLPANKIELWARIESDRMASPVFRDFFSERDVVMEERRQRIDSDPDGKLYEQFLAAAFTTHPYRNPILGWATDMMYLSPGHTYDFFRKYYAPNNTIITVVGDIEPASTLKLIRKYFESIPRQPIKRKVITEEPRQQGEKRIEIIFDANPKLIIGYHKPTLPSFDDYVFDMIDYISSNGRTSRFYKKLVEEKAIAENINVMSSVPGSRYPNLFAIFAAPRAPATYLELELEIYRELDRLKTELVPAEELEKIKNIMKAEFIRGLNSNAALANKLSYFEAIAGDYRYILDHIKKIEQITPENIRETAAKYLTADNRTVAIIKRKS